MCPCLSKECLDVIFDRCATEVEIPVAATSTGTYRVTSEFNGVLITANVEVVSGENIVLPNNLFNGNYTHTIRIYTSGTNLLNDTCYKITTMASIFAPVLPSPPTPGTGSDLIIYAKVGDPSDPLAQGYDYTFTNEEDIIIPEAAGKRVILFRDGVMVLENSTGYSRGGTDYSTFTIVGGATDESLTFVIAQDIVYVPPVEGNAFSSAFSSAFN